jgi:hypothetical protein
LALTGLWHFLNTLLACNHADGGVGKADAVRKLFDGKLNNKGYVLLIGHTEMHLEAAKSLGCRLVLLSNGLRNQAFLESLKGAVVKPSIEKIKNDIVLNLKSIGMQIHVIKNIKMLSLNIYFSDIWMVSFIKIAVGFLSCPSQTVSITLQANYQKVPMKLFHLQIIFLLIIVYMKTQRHV